MKRSIADVVVEEENGKTTTTTSTTSWNDTVGGVGGVLYEEEIGNNNNNVEFARTSRLSVPYYAAVQSQSPSFCGITWDFERGGIRNGSGMAHSAVHAADSVVVVSSPPIGRSNQRRLTVHHNEVSNSVDVIATTIGSSSSGAGDDDYADSNFLEDFKHLASKVDALTLKELNALSFQQREVVYNDVHGVSELTEETPDVVQDHMTQLDKELQRLIKDATKDTSAYEQAIQQSIDHVQEESFRIMFLRAALFDVEVAAEKIITYFRAKLELWGTFIFLFFLRVASRTTTIGFFLFLWVLLHLICFNNLLTPLYTYFLILYEPKHKKQIGAHKLVEDITYDDFNEDDLEVLESGCYQLLPESRDRSGRGVVVVVRKNDHGWKSWKSFVSHIYV